MGGESTQAHAELGIMHRPIRGVLLGQKQPWNEGDRTMQAEPTRVKAARVPTALLNPGRCGACGKPCLDVQRWANASRQDQPRDLCLKCMRMLARNALHLHYLEPDRALAEAHAKFQWRVEKARRRALELEAIETERLHKEAARAAVIFEKPKRKPISRRKRYAILQRDGFKCLDCGRNPEEDGVKLHVDHQIPVALGGGNDDQNLWTLCMDCNQGKGASL